MTGRWQDEPCPVDGLAWEEHPHAWPPAEPYPTARAGLAVADLPDPDTAETEEERRDPTALRLATPYLKARPPAPRVPGLRRQPTLRGLRRGGAWAVEHLAEHGLPTDLAKPAVESLVRRERARRRREQREAS